MYRKACWTVVAVAVILNVNGRSWADDQDAARAVIAKAIQATGGEDRLAKFRGATWKSKGVYYGMGAGLDYTADYAVQWPSQMRVEIQGFVTMVINGEQGWISANGSTMEMPKEQRETNEADMHANYVARLLPLKDKVYKLSLVGESKVADKPAIGVKVSKKGRNDVSLFFDKATNLLVKVETRLKDEQGQEVTQEMLFSDFKDVDGIKTSTKLKINRDGKLFVEAESFDQKLVEKLDEALFAKP